MFYLKYRPRTISQIDNTRVRTVLQKVLQGENIPHALLFVGQKGTGKTSAARIFAKAVNCLNNKFSKKAEDFEPCNECSNCKSIDASTHTDVIEMDAASNRGIEEVKSLIREVAYSPMAGRYRVFIIDEAHMITGDGFNALLKTLEEPPESAVFILATTNLEKVPSTIVSRCVKVNFGRGKIADIVSMLKRISQSEKFEFGDPLLKLIATQSDYSFRDAAKFLEEVSVQKIKELTDLETFFGLRGRTDLIEIIAQKDSKKTYQWIEEFSQGGGNFKNLLEHLLEKLRVQLLMRRGVEVEEEEKLSLTTTEITKLIKLLMEAYQTMRSTPIDSLPLEIALSEFYNDTKIKN